MNNQKIAIFSDIFWVLIIFLQLSDFIGSFRVDVEESLNSHNLDLKKFRIIDSFTYLFFIQVRAEKSDFRI